MPLQGIALFILRLYVVQSVKLRNIIAIVSKTRKQHSSWDFVSVINVQNPIKFAIK